MMTDIIKNILISKDLQHTIMKVYKRLSVNTYIVKDTSDRSFIVTSVNQLNVGESVRVDINNRIVVEQSAKIGKSTTFMV